MPSTSQRPSARRSVRATPTARAAGSGPAAAGAPAGPAAAARAAPDGYTLIFGTTSTMVVNPLVMKDVPYDFWKDFALIGLIGDGPHILAVRDGLPAKSATDLVAMAKASPGKYTIASSGVGTIVQMAA